MSYLLAKIVFLLLLAAVLGGCFAWWLLRRRFEDVTVQHTSVQRDWAAWRQGLDAKLAHPPVVDLDPVNTRLQSLEAGVRAIEIPRHVPTDLSPVLAAVAAVRIPPPAPPVDLAPVQTRLVDLEKLVRGIVIPAPKEPDLSAVVARLASLESHVTGLRMPEAPPAVDLAPLQAQLDAVERAVAAIRIPAAPPPADLAPMQARLAEIEKAVKAIVVPVHKEPDLSAVVSRLGGMESRLGAFKLPDPPAPVNLQPMHNQLDALARAVAAIHIPPAAASAAPVDLMPLQARMAGLEAAVKGMAFPAPKEPDFSAIVSRLSAFETRLGALRMPEPAAPIDITPLHARMAELERAVKGIAIPAPREPDLSAVMNRFATLESRVGAIRMPEAQPAVDLTPVRARLEALERAVTGIRIPQPQTVDLSHVEAQLAGLERTLGAPRAEVDLRPTQDRLSALEAAVRGIVIPPAARVDLGPVLERMGVLEGALELRLAALARPPAPQAAPTPAAAATPVAAAIPADLVRSGSRNLLARAAFGPADDLKLIKGIAGVLEKMLHGIGVYYFWQMAEWTPDDIAYVDTQLTAFKGRIRRDDWKNQATGFARRPESARKPKG